MKFIQTMAWSGMRGSEGTRVDWSVCGSPQGLLLDCMWGVREEGNPRGLLGLRFEKWGRSQRCHLPGWRRPE